MGNRTIAAISTPQGVGGIAVIRISGDDAVGIADRVFEGKIKLTDAKSHTVHYGHIINNEKQIVDEVLVVVMRAPKTYTREDVVEINTHGGIIASKNVLKCIIEAGAYVAEPGEFTKRAFLNGRIDLTQAEGIIDVINSKTSLENANALKQVKGSLFDEITRIREYLLRLSASMQVIIDYPDEELEDVTNDDILNGVTSAIDDVDKLIKSSEDGKIIKNGIKTTIAGKPNVGKSSLLNLLSKQERAIVTDIAGTTRDVIEESVNIGGVALILTDTAGIRKTDDVVEKIGVQKSKESIEEADLVIVMLDASQSLDDEEIKLLRETKDKKRIILINKTDIKDDKAMKKIYSEISCEAIEFSTKTGQGASELTQKIKQLYNIGEIGMNDRLIVTNIRHVNALIKAKEALTKAKKSMEDNLPSDFATIDINIAMDALGEITGKVVTEDIVNTIFHDFCVGK